MDNRYVKGVARQSGSNFYFSFFSLPKTQREAITAVYAFCREVDDAVDSPGAADPRQTIAEWRDEIARTYDGHPKLPLTQSLAEAIERFSLSRSYFEGILDGVAMDLDKQRYPAFEDLSSYCYHVAGEVGLLCMEIFGYRSERLKSYAVKMGMAFQLTNILRDIGADARNGRIYIPQVELARFGVGEDQILAWAEERRASCFRLPSSPAPRRVLRWTSSPGWPSFRNLMAFQVQRARGYYRDAAVLPIAGERPALRAAEIMRAIYADIRHRIERRDFQVFGPRIRVPTPVKLWLAAKTWWECR